MRNKILDAVVWTIIVLLMLPAVAIGFVLCVVCGFDAVDDYVKALRLRREKKNDEDPEPPQDAA